MKKDLRVLLAASMFSNFAFGLFGPLYAVFAQMVGGDILAVSGAWAVFALVTGLLTIVFGKLGAMKVSKKAMVTIGYFVFGLGYLGYFFVEDTLGLFLVQVILGIGTAVIEPAWNAIYSISLEKGKESYQWSIWSGIVSIVVAVAAISGGFIVSIFGFKALFLIMFCFDVIAAFVTYKVLD
jgi:DHA1 family bicyclomycin/chloramphenicol resistance-like MFS transporter